MTLAPPCRKICLTASLNLTPSQLPNLLHCLLYFVLGVRQSLPWDALFGDLLSDPHKDERLAPQSPLTAQQEQEGSDSARAGSSAAALGADTTPVSLHLVSEGVHGSASQVAESLAQSSDGNKAHVKGLNADEHYEFVASARFISPVPSRVGATAGHTFALSVSSVPL